MPYAIHLFFDSSTEKVIKSAWKQLADTSIAPYMHQSGNRPHFTLAIYQSLDLKQAEERINIIASAQNPLSVDFAYIGFFPTIPGTIFLGSTVTNDLLGLHAQVHESMTQIGLNPDPYYLPGRWMPHCTLALEIEPELTIKVLRVGLHIPLPIHGRIIEVGIIEFRPVKHLFRTRLVGEEGH